MRNLYLVLVVFCLSFISVSLHGQTYRLQVWNDQNGNGMFDGGEPGLPLEDANITVWLDSNSNGVLDGGESAIAATSLGGGLFEYALAGNGDYSVSYNEFPWYVSRYLQGGVDSDVEPLSNVGTFTVTAATPDPFTGFDLGLILASEVETFVWEDLNGDGIQDGGEPGIGGGSFTLVDNGTGAQALDVNGNAVLSVDQGAGTYTFSLLFPGNYSIDYGPTGPILMGDQTYPTEIDQGANDDLDSDVVQATSISTPFTLNDDELKEDVDAGFYLPGTIRTYVWNDANGDGVQDGTEADIDGIVGIELIDNNTGMQALDPLGVGIVSAGVGGGEYEFLEVPPGNYHIQYVLPTPTGPDPYIPTLAHYSGASDDATDVADDSDADDDDVSPTYLQSHAFDMESDELEEDVDAGFILPAKITCFVWEDLNGDGVQDAGEPGIGGAPATLLLDDGVTAANDITGVPPAFTDLGAGLYEFANLAPGNYIVEFGIPPSPAAVPFYPTLWNDDTNNTNAGDTDGDSDAEAPSATAANYLQSYVIELAAEENEERVDAGFYVPGNVGNMVFCDKNGNGLFDGPDDAEGVELVTVKLVNPITGDDPALDAEGNPLEMLTDAAGMYLFELVPPGTYNLNFTAPPGFEISPQDATGASGAADVDDDSDADVGNGDTEDFVLMSQQVMLEEETNDCGMYQLINISGTVWLDEGMDNLFTTETGVAGVLVEIYDTDDLGTPFDMSTTFGGGVYQFGDIPPGEYIISIAASNFDPGSPLAGTESCMGNGDPTSEIDNDDDGQDGIPAETVAFLLLSNCDRDNPPFIEYIDFCFGFDCNIQNPLATPTCEQAADQVICNLPDLEGFCSRMFETDSPGSQPDPLCPGQGNTTAHNISWFAFIAGEGTYNLTIVPSACSGDNPGVQIGVYTDCTFDEAVFCNGNCNLDAVVVPSTDLEPGETYYIFIDGCNSSVCSYTIEIDGSYSNPTLFVDDICVATEDPGNPDCSDQVTVCPDVELDLVLTGIEANIDFTWSVTTVSGGPYVGDDAPETMVAELSVSFENEGVYIVCMETGTNGCDFTQNPPRCIEITVAAIPDEDFPDQFVCEGELDGFDINVLSDTSIPENDPNGDGIFGWQAPTQTWVIGQNTGTVMDDNGCMYEQTFEIIELQNPPTEDVHFVLCESDLPLIYNGEQYILADFINTTTIVEQDLPLLIPASNGCDSTINLVVELLNINGSNGNPICTNDGIELRYQFLPGFVIPADWVVTYQWFDPFGIEITDNDNDPLTIIATGGSGQYILQITVERINPVSGETVTCILDPIGFNVNLDLFIPVDPVVTGPDVVCEGSIAQYVATGGFEVDYNWTFPTTITSATFSGDFNDTLTIDWAGTNGGILTVFSANDCGMSGTIEYPVTAIPQPTASFTADQVVCVDSSATIEFTGDPSMISAGGYSWDFSGGTITNGTGGSGPGPHLVDWDTPGIVTVTLSFVDENGCESTVATEMITVEAPIAAPVVTCDPAAPIGSVIFTWPDVAGASYTIEITSDPSTYTDFTLDGNMVTVNGVGEGVSISMILTTLTGTACNEVVSTEVTCTAQNCDPPTITVSSEIAVLCLDDTPNLVQTISFTADPVSAGTAVFSSPSAGINATTGEFDATVAGPGVHTITVTYTDPDGCVGSGNTVVRVNAVPVAAFSPDVDEICITEEIMFIYSGTANPTSFMWDFGADVATTGTGPMPSVSWSSPGMKTITLSVIRDGCTSETVTLTVDVQPEIEDLIVTCVDQESTSVTFSWNGIDGATGYEVSINGGAATTVTDTFWVEAGLVPMDQVDITVTAVMGVGILCDAPSGSSDCVAMDCPDFTSMFTTTDLDVCLTPTIAPIPLELVVEVVGGGTTMGTFAYGGDPNVNPFGGTFDPTGLPPGPYPITVTYTEIPTGCTHSNTITFNLIEQPDASFSISDDDICITETVTVLFEGGGLAGAMPAWVVSGGTIAATATTNEYEWTFDAAGTYTIDLTVDNQGCIDMATQQTVTVGEQEAITNIMCSPGGTGEINISWDGAGCATEYTIIIDGMAVATQTGTTYLATGLFSGDHDIEIQATSSCACDILPASTVCEASGCPPITVVLAADTQDWCVTGDLSPVAITVDVMGGNGSGTVEWSGDGDGAGSFDPSGLGAGTYTVTYTYTEEDCPPAVQTIEFMIFDEPIIAAMVTNPDCYTDTEGSVLLDASGGVGPYVITVDGDAVSAGEVMLPAGSYTAEITDANGCTSTTTFAVVIPAALSFDDSDISGLLDVITGSSQTYTIDPSLFGGVTVEDIIWQSSTGEVYCQSPACFEITQTFNENDSITVTVIYNDGCSVQTAFEVTTKTITIIDVVNIISLNGDGNNDIFSIFTNDPNVVFNSVSIYDRWGNRVATDPGWTGTGLHEVWDGRFNGTEVTPGVYVYTMEYVENGITKVRNGDVTVVR